ncbi:AMP-binding protein [Methylomarinum sp. Ch1-1]|uniref:AMP-binding protein n=1 Tax=Methylomarinum roseum TaxID=3067653 RepID=A0AAU7NSR4_9GAMM|nr:AMP-binding protein [Methylomarinum sp. Ch1-1]MDP4519978.1 AMP-binding protein [Methylomarinum sp. Ch1-1]
MKHCCKGYSGASTIIGAISTGHDMAKSYFHRGGDAPLLGKTIPEHFADMVERHGDREAVVGIPQRLRLSYVELAGEVDRLARGLLAFGFKRGDRIGIWSTNNLQWILVQLASARIGAILVNINPAYRIQELEYALKQSRVQCLLCIPTFKNSDYTQMLMALLPELSWQSAEQLSCERLPDLRRVVIFNPHDPLRTAAPAQGFTRWTELVEAGREIAQSRLERLSAELDIDDAINIQYTSGTTGFPKAVVLSHHNILNNAWFSARAMHFSESDKLCIAVPFYHCFGMVLANLLCFSVGACAVISCEHFDAGAVLQTIDEERCTALHGVPTMFIAELEHQDFDRYRLDSLRTGIMAGAPCPAELMQQVMQDMHCRDILIGYGETEASPLTHLTSREDSLYRRTQTVGRNLPHQEVKIVGIAGDQTLPLGENGEICFRGYHIMQGYYRDQAATDEAIDAQGWLHSGDVGMMDEEGYVSITGRLKEMIIRGGENIYPREIEDLLYSHPKVAAVAVFGVPDRYYGEQVAAWIRLRSGQQSSAKEMREFCGAKLSHFKIPRYIRFVDSFPMTVTGKIQKFQMRKQMLESMDATTSDAK